VAITNTLRLFQLPPTVQRLVADGQLSAGHARALLGTPDRSFQESLARRAVAEGLSVRAVEDAVRDRNELGGAGRAAAGRQTDCGPQESSNSKTCLSTHLDTRVKVDMGSRRAKWSSTLPLSKTWSGFTGR